MICEGNEFYRPCINLDFHADFFRLPVIKTKKLRHQGYKQRLLHTKMQPQTSINKNRHIKSYATYKC